MSAIVRDELIDKILELADATIDTWSAPSDSDWEEIANPRISKVVSFSDWRREVPDCIDEVWDSLPDVAKLCVYIMAEDTVRNAIWMGA